MLYFYPTINFNTLQYISSSASSVTNSQEVSNYLYNLLEGLLVDFKNHIISGSSKHTMYIIF